jgi:poly-gamma-glutamate capsule biosynthesis protein CapA/YwtB (metallophosphatase superfamily)
MLGTNFPDSSYLPPDSGRFLLANVAPQLRNADLTFGNLEGIVLDSGGVQKTCSDPSLCYLFRMPRYLAGNLKDAGFDALSTANNHAGDFGDEGRVSTLKVLDSLGIQHAGQLMHPVSVFDHRGIKWGFIAFSPNTGTLSITDIETAEQMVSELDRKVDIVLVSFHGGAEGSKHQHITRQTEEYYGEDRGNVYEFSHRLVDAGADVIFGHGPHVTRAIEVYNNRLIAYSLGNFATYARFNLRGENGIAPMLKVYTSNKGKFFSAEIIPVKQIGEGIPTIDPDKEVIKTLQQLTKDDFPEVPLQISENGKVSLLIE